MLTQFANLRDTLYIGARVCNVHGVCANSLQRSFCIIFLSSSFFFLAFHSPLYAFLSCRNNVFKKGSGTFLHVRFKYITTKMVAAMFPRFETVRNSFAL